MYNQVGACPHCGNPIYSYTFYHSVFLPPVYRTCSCMSHSQPTWIYIPRTGPSTIVDPESTDTWISSYSMSVN